MIPLEIFVGEAMEATEVAGPGEGQVLAAAPGDAVGFGKPGARRRRGDVAGGEDGGKNSEELVDLNLICLNTYIYSTYIYVCVCLYICCEDLACKPVKRSRDVDTFTA